METLTKIPTEILYVTIAAAGGMARYLQHYLNDGEFSIAHFLSHIFVSSFSGYMFYQFAVNILGLPEATVAVCAGLGGWMGVEALKMIESFFKDKLKK